MQDDNIEGRGYKAKVTHDGKTMTVDEWALHLGWSHQTIYVRLFCLGWSVEDALTKKPRMERHGAYGTTEYVIWKSMRQRCNDPNCKCYDRYGGRGIKVCKEWEDSFQAFLDHVGKRPSNKHSIERIDNSRGYEPGNVVWATQDEQSRNTRSNVLLTFNGETKILKDWARAAGLSNTTLWNRLYTLGWDIERALTTPPGKNGRKVR